MTNKIWTNYKKCDRLLIAQNSPDSWIQQISQATVKNEMTRVNVVAADDTVAIYSQQCYKMYG